MQLRGLEEEKRGQQERKGPTRGTADFRVTFRAETVSFTRDLFEATSLPRDESYTVSQSGKLRRFSELKATTLSKVESYLVS